MKMHFPWMERRWSKSSGIQLVISWHSNFSIRDPLYENLYFVKVVILSTTLGTVGAHLSLGGCIFC